MPRKIVIILLVFGLLAGGTYYFLFSEEEKAAFDLITVTTGDVTEKALAIGEIAPRTEIQVKSKNWRDRQASFCRDRRCGTSRAGPR
jgi:Flp pilus assembly secretin CpaC